MRAADRLRGLLPLLLAVAAGCGRVPAPAGWLPTPEEAQQEAFGGWARLDLRGPSPALVEGELIAVSADSVFVLGEGGLVAVAAASVAGGTVATYDPNLGGIAVWAGLGAASTLTHGFFLALTGPTWGLTGVLASRSAAAAARHAVGAPGEHLAWSPYARFPQGLPPGLDRRSLRAKPARR